MYLYSTIIFAIFDLLVFVYVIIWHSYLIRDQAGTADQIGVYLICAQGFLNAIAVNEKLVHDTIRKFYKRLGIYHPQTSTEMVSSRGAPTTTITPTKQSTSTPEGASATLTETPNSSSYGTSTITPAPISIVVPEKPWIYCSNSIV
jgi:hypothetical protein